MADIVLQAVIKKAVDIAGNLRIFWTNVPFEIESAKRKRFFSRIFGYIYNAHNFKAEIEGIKEKVNDINRRRQTYGIQERHSSSEEGTWNARRSFPHLDEPNIIGFEEHIKNLVAMMLDESSQHGVISITGMAGLGKTTLAKKVYNSCQQSFECSAWICVSQQPNIAELLRDIARQVGLEKEKWKHGVEVNLLEFLFHKRYVIVIDDIWEIKSWDALKTGIPCNFDSGSRIFLTSRNRDVGVHIGGQSSLFELQPLDSDNSRILFHKMAKAPPELMKEASCDPPQLQNIGEQILRRCGGVPLAIVLVAGILSHRERTVAKETSFFIAISDEVTCNSGIRVRRVTFHRSNLDDKTFFNNFRIAELRAVICFGEDD
ncbi:toMV resistance protein Tm-2(2)-like [Actinidia eriantha]|uniref:toMV resistance protein Tm-2(2)-like n=1 Tax=Actinidia eriantha TaxID=165200 RepID=UPI0025848C96|nr:toMV resistance protein Tm-2(2)-like [Actinidia eriantha]